MSPASVTRMMHTRGAMVIVMAVTLVSTLVVYLHGMSDAVFETDGFVSAWSGRWTLTPLMGLVTEWTLNIAIVTLLVHVNKYYNLLRSFTKLQATFFIIMQAVTPTLVLHFNPGTLMCLVVMVCMWQIYMVYGGEPVDTRRVFLIAAMLSGFSAIDYAYALYLPVFIIACIEMRVFSLRTLVAFLLGVFTPWIIMLGFGIVDVDALRLPDGQLFIGRLDDTHQRLLVVTGAFTCFIAFGALLQNVFKILTYNAHSRAMLNVLTTLTIATMLAAIVNSANLLVYMPLLNCCAAMQLAHLFGAVHVYAKSYIAILLIALLYIIILSWKIVIHLT